MFDSVQIWNTTLDELKKDMRPEKFSMWLKDTYVDRFVDGTLYVAVPNAFAKEWLHQKYHKTIMKILRDVSEHVRGIEYCVSKRRSTERRHIMIERNERDRPALYKISKPDTRFSPYQSSGDSLRTSPLPIKDAVHKQSNLNPRYTTETYVVGPFNELAFSAGKAIIHKPGVYNPLYIYGETGLGKTHLIQAVGNELRKTHPALQVYYVTSEQFTNDFVSAIRNNRMPIFRERYRKHDVLIMDDIQFLSGKDKNQEELFHLFNTLHNNNKQIIFSSDKHPNMILGLEDRLQSRFSQGMVVDINRPEYESRVSILLTKAQEMGYEFDSTIIEHIASHVEGNIRELEGIINSLAVQMQIRGAGLTTAEVKHYIRNHIKPKKQISIPEIVQIIARFYNIGEDLIYAKTRRKEIVRSRQVVMYLLREDYSISYPHIGKELGGRDHTTVIHSCDKIKHQVQADPELVNELEQLRSILSHR